MSINIVHIVSNKVWGGGERYALDLCKAQSAHGHSIGVITRSKKAVDTHFTQAGFTPGHLPLLGRLDIISPIVLARVLNRMEAPVVIHVHNFKDADVAVRARQLMEDPAKVRIVMTRHLAKAAKTGSYATGLYAQIDALIFVSETARRAFTSTSPDIDSAKLHVIYNAVTPPDQIKAAMLDDDKTNIVFLGRIHPEKGIDTLIRALALSAHKDKIKLHIAGTGRPTYVTQLHKLASALEVSQNIQWHGAVADIWPLVAAAQIGVLPSTVTEACPMTVGEFFAMGVPVIATDHGGQTEFITHGHNGMLIPAGDEKALARAIDTLVAEPKLRKKTGENARDTASQQLQYHRFYNAIMQTYGQ